ncbi:hypothetical protein Hdeb2414_s0026g00681231 [Helianthus debilis subsp. tardiflorus]
MNSFVFDMIFSRQSNQACLFLSTSFLLYTMQFCFNRLCATFLIEFMVLRYGNDIERQSWIISIVWLIFVVLASCQLLYPIYTYRDYETLNHEMLQSLIEKVNGMQGNFPVTPLLLF